MRKWLNLFLVILVCKFSLNYWVSLPLSARHNIIRSFACEFAQKAEGKAAAFEILDLENWTIEIHVEFVEMGV